MQHKSKRTRFRILAVGALVGSVLSAGIATSDVSAGSKTLQNDQEIVVTVDLGSVGTSSLRSGIRW
jgi:hypothetical protein